jgi:hypothetical protein
VVLKEGLVLLLMGELVELGLDLGIVIVLVLNLWMVLLGNI